MRHSKRTRYIVGALFLVGLGLAWWWAFATTPPREFLYVVAFTIALALVFEGLERKAWLPRSGGARFLLELLFAAISLVAIGWFISIVLPGR